ncbi:hypothetical protein BDB01DRAFT_783669 [Pilobolus umbonatus]|nr:hypothetical protein BDB01DRAFT_783669 [Pilobolus umbonatus]
MDPVYSNLYKHSCQPKISPNGAYVANAVENRLVIRSHGEDLEVLTVYEGPGEIDFIQWSADSHYILAVNYTRSRIDVRSMQDSQWHCIIKDPGFPLSHVKWGPDSQSIICISDLNMRLSVWSLSNKEVKLIHHVKYVNKGVESSPDNKYIAIAEVHQGKDHIGIYHGTTYHLLERFEVDTVDMENMKWSPNSDYLCVWDNCLYNTLLVYRPDGYRCTTYSPYEEGLGIKSVSWSPNNQFIAMGTYDQTVHLLSAQTWQLIAVLNHSMVINSAMDVNVYEEYELPTPTATLEPTVEYQQRRLRPLKIPILRPEYNTPHPKVGIGLCQFSADSTYLCTKSDDMATTLWIWDIRSLSCSSIILFRHTIHQVTWNPSFNAILMVVCGDEHMLRIEPRHTNEIQMTTMRVPTGTINSKSNS